MTALVQSHHYNQLYELQKQHKWGKNDVEGNYHSVRDLVGQRLGVLGYGSIGRQGVHPPHTMPQEAASTDKARSN